MATAIPTDEKAISAVLFEELRKIAPEIEPAEVDLKQPLREQVDLDSLDAYRYLVAVHERFHVDIPEADYPRLQSVQDIITYIETAHESHP